MRDIIDVFTNWVVLKNTLKEREEKKIVTSLYVFCKAFNKPKNPPILERVKQMHAYSVLHIHVRQYLFALFQKYEYISI